MAESVQEVKQQAKKSMEKALEALQRHFARVRTGRASLALLDGIRVEYYGTPTPLNQVASLSIPEPRLIAIQPWDKSVIPAIEKAILQSELDLNPTNDGNVVRVPIPKLTEERRKELVKVVRGMAEEARVAVRNARREANSELDRLQKEKAISEDDQRRMKDEIQKLTDEYVAKVDQVLKQKEAEIMEV
ncbi:ribosome recycling factor [Deferrisoma camini]|uniref:ribosome recycling factor n=1 Tax=Deferrisoma camini TaxID=1035120 RepID=UPI0004A4C0F8|nr:ribosome recycling factor [Deferrisoma camini]